MISMLLTKFMFQFRQIHDNLVLVNELLDLCKTINPPVYNFQD